VHRAEYHRDHTHDVGDSTVARTLAVLTFLAFALHYRYGAAILDLAAFIPSQPLRHFGFPILASAFLATDPWALLAALAAFALCAAPLERRIGGAWTWALFFWGHLASIGAQLLLSPAHLPGYRTWGANAGILALLVAFALLSGLFHRDHDPDFEVPNAPPARGAWLWLILYILGTLAGFALDRSSALGVSGEGTIAGMFIGAVGAWTYRSGNAFVRLFSLAGPLSRVAVIGIAVLAGTAHRDFLVGTFQGSLGNKPRAPIAAGTETLPPSETRREPSAMEGKIDTFLESELGSRELIFAAVDPAEHMVAFAGDALWVSGKWHTAAMLWDDEGFSAAGAGLTVRVRKPSVLDRSVAVLVNGSPIAAWPGSRLSAARLRELAQKPPNAAKSQQTGVEIR